MIEGSLYKYLPSEYAESYTKGEILFRPLSYFIFSDGNGRGDPTEGTHIDWPHDDVSFDVFEPDAKTYKGTMKGDFALRRSVKHPHKSFIHCTSRRFDFELFDRFSADCCIEIREPKTFANLLRSAIKMQIPFLDKQGVIFENVEYYDIKQARVCRDIDRAENIPFFKPIEYKCEAEFRFLFARPSGLQTTLKLTNSAYNRLEEDSLKQTFRKKFIRIDDISPICRVHTMHDFKAA